MNQVCSRTLCYPGAALLSHLGLELGWLLVLAMPTITILAHGTSSIPRAAVRMALTYETHRIQHALRIRGSDGFATPRLPLIFGQFSGWRSWRASSARQVRAGVLSVSFGSVRQQSYTALVWPIPGVFNINNRTNKQPTCLQQHNPK